MADIVADQDLFLVRSGRPQDWRALKMILPEAVYFGSAVIAFVAIENARNLITGAITISPELRHVPLPGAHVALHVLPAFYDRGIEEQLFVAEANVVGSNE